MGIFRYAIRMLKKDLIQCSFYILSMCCSIAVLFNMFNILYNENFTAKGDSTYIIYSFIAVILLVVALIFIVFANLYFIYSKTKEFAIVVLSGRSVHELGFIILLQNIILGIIGSALGIIVGVLLLPLSNSIVYNFVGLQPELWHFSKMGVLTLVLIMGMQFILMVLVDMGYVYRREISELVRETNEGYDVDKRTVKVNPNVYLIGYLLPIIVPIVVPMNISSRAGISLLLIIPSIAAIKGLFSFFIPQFILKLKEKIGAYDKVKLIALSNLHYSIRKASLLIITLVISISILTLLTLTSYDRPEIQIVCLATYIVIVVFIAITIVYKMLIEVINRKNVFKQVLLLGYTRKEISKIIRNEVIYFFGIVILIPNLQFGVLFLLSVLDNIMHLRDAAILLGGLTVTFLIAAIITYIAYSSIIKKYIKSF